MTNVTPMALRLNGPKHVRIVAGLLVLLGGVSLLIGFLAGAALGRDVRVDGTLRQVAFGPALIASGSLALSAGWRNRRFENRARGLFALALLGAVGLAYFPPINPCSAVALYGLLVYLSPPGRDAFRSTYWRKTSGGTELVSPGARERR
jgi:hypothetical protein